MKNRLIIFDLDGTLLNTIGDLAVGCDHMLTLRGLPTHTYEQYCSFVGNGILRLVERALPEEHRNEATVLRLREYFVPYYDAHNCDLTHPYDGISELLQALKAAGHTLAVASNKYQAATEKIVAQLFPGIFDVVLGERDGVPRKPDPQIVYDILSTVNYQLSTENCLYIGDSLVDAETAKAAKATLVLCTWGFCTEEQLATAQPNYMIYHPSEILQIIQAHE